MREGVHAGAVGGEHRMQRLDRERHVCLPRMGQERGERVAHLPSRVADVARALRQPADHEDEALRADGGGFVDRAAVVVERRAPPGVIGGGKHAAAAKAGDGHPVRADEFCRALEAAGLHDVAPGRDRGNAGAGAAFDELLERPRLHRHRIDREQGAVLRKVAHHACTPRAAITWRMRPAARSGSASRPAASASRNNSARCRVERALSWPPTSVK